MSFFDDLAKNTDTPSIIGNIGREGYKGQTSTQKSTAGLTLAPASEQELMAGKDISAQYDWLKQFLGQGPGLEAQTQANTDQNSFLQMMRGIASSGGMPTDEDRRQSNIFADDLFKPQMEALNQSFTQQNEGAARLAAQLNRPINDPIIQAKLRQEQMRQSSMLSADRSAFVAQESRNSPFRRLELQGQLADASSGLASQAMANRMQLLNLGNSLQSQERNWRLQTAEKYGTQEAHSGGGVTGAWGSMMGGIGSAVGIAGSFMGTGGASSATGSAPKSPQIAGGMDMQTSQAYGQGGFMSQGGYQSNALGINSQPNSLYGNYKASNARNSRLNYSGVNGATGLGGNTSNLFGTGRMF